MKWLAWLGLLTVAACTPPTILTHPLPAQVLLAADWRQTLAFRHAGDIELNPLIGPRPSAARVTAHVAVSSGILWLMQRAPAPQRRWFNAFMAVAEGFAVTWNLLAARSR